MIYIFAISCSFKNLEQTAKKICAIYGDSAIAESIVCKWFARFRSGDCIQLMMMSKLKYWLKIIMVAQDEISQKLSTYLIWALEDIWKCLGTWIPMILGCRKDFNGLHFHLQFSVQMQQNSPVFF